MARFIEFDNKMINTNLIARTGFYDNTSDGEKTGRSVIFIFLTQPINNEIVIKGEYLGKEQRAKARIDYEKLKKDLKNSWQIPLGVV